MPERFSSTVVPTLAKNASMGSLSGSNAGKKKRKVGQSAPSGGPFICIVPKMEQVWMTQLSAITLV